MKVNTISEQLLFTTIKITTELKNGSSSGTGFVFRTPINETEYDYYIVTNKHVIKDAINGNFRFIANNNDSPDLQNPIEHNLSNFESLWYGHSDDKIDVAIIPFLTIYEEVFSKTGEDIFFRAVDAINIPNINDITDKIDALENIVFIGYPNGIIDNFNNTPIIRRGTTATPYALDFNAEKKFLVDASVFGGSSGSPVFLLQEGIHKEKIGNSVVLNDKFFFLGIIAEVFYKDDLNDLYNIPIPTNNTKTVAHNKQMIDLGIVFKAETILETIEQYKKSIE
jgi:hypothetical protein